MRKVVVALSLTVFLAMGTGCAQSEELARDCPTPPAVTFSDSPDGANGDLMDAVAGETDRFGKDLIGLDEETAMACVEEVGLTWRVYEQDGEQFALTMDYRAERVNVKIDDGRITDAYSG